MMLYSSDLYILLQAPWPNLFKIHDEIIILSGDRISSPKESDFIISAPLRVNK